MRYQGQIIDIIADNLKQGIEYDKGESVLIYDQFGIILLKTEYGNYVIEVKKK